ncbi:MAG: arylsulfotransferase family protein [Eubacterium sp.]
MEKSGKILAIAAGVALVLVIMVSAALAYSGRDITLLQDRMLHLSINGYAVEIPLDEDGQTFDIPSLTTETPNEFILMNDAGSSIEVNETKLQTGKKAKISVKKISSNELLTVVITNGKDTRTLYFRTKSAQLPEMIATGSGNGEGEYYVTDTEKALMYKLNQYGEITWYVALTQEQADGKIFTDFKKHILENDAIRYSYHIVDPDIETMGIDGYLPGTRVILDEKYKEVRRDGARVSLLNKDEKNHDKKVMGDPIDGNGFILLDDHHSISQAYKLESVNNIPAELKPDPLGSKVAAAVIQEVKDNQVVFEWKSTDHPELYVLSEKGNDFANSTTKVQDYLHINDMILDPSDDNLIVSFKNANTILKIDRKTGEIMWVLSGKGDQFGMSDAQKFSAQSDISLAEDGTLIVFDNGNATGKTRVVKLKLDEANKKLKEYKEFSMPGHVTTNFGSAEKVDPEKDIYTIGWGINNDNLAALTEMNFTDNKKMLDVVFPNGEKTMRIQKMK